MTLEERLIHLEGRIGASELLIRGIMALIIRSQPGNPLANLEADRRDFKSSLQQLERPIGDHSDAVWEAATDAIDHQLDQLVIRFKDEASRKPA